MLHDGNIIKYFVSKLKFYDRREDLIAMLANFCQTKLPLLEYSNSYYIYVDGSYILKNENDLLKNYGGKDKLDLYHDVKKLLIALQANNHISERLAKDLDVYSEVWVQYLKIALTGNFKFNMYIRSSFIMLSSVTCIGIILFIEITSYIVVCLRPHRIMVG